MLRKLDLLTLQERKIGLLTVFSSYSSSVTSLLIASQFPFAFTYMVFWHFSFLQTFIQENERKMTPEDRHLLKEGLPGSYQRLRSVFSETGRREEKEWWHP